MMKRLVNPPQIVRRMFALLFINWLPLRWRYAVLYLVVLVGFACVYSSLPGENFYHANVGREPMLHADKERIANELEKSIATTFQSSHGDSEEAIENWRIDPSTFKVRFLEAYVQGTDVEIRFKLSVQLTDASNPAHPKLFVDPLVAFSATEERTSPVDVGDENKTLLKTVRVDIPGVPYWNKEQNQRLAEVLFPTQTTRFKGKGYATVENNSLALPEVMMPIPKRLSQEILDLAKGIQGDPSNLNGHFERVLYLSAVTITTLGYGDIAPLTTGTRLLILVEAVGGIVLIGLFIAAPQTTTARSNTGSPSKESAS